MAEGKKINSLRMEYSEKKNTVCVSYNEHISLSNQPLQIRLTARNIKEIRLYFS
jgi:hypothetical protein